MLPLPPFDMLKMRSHTLLDVLSPHVFGDVSTQHCCCCFFFFKGCGGTSLDRSLLEKQKIFIFYNTAAN